MGNGSKLQETGGPTPTGQLPCTFLPSVSLTRHACRPLNLFAYYIRNGYIRPPDQVQRAGTDPMSRAQPPRDFSERVFSVLLMLYPRAFRTRFGDEMLAFFRARRNEARHREATRGSIRLWRHLVFDIVLTAPLEHWRAWEYAGTDSNAVQADVPWSSPFYLEREESMDALRQDLRFAFRTLRARPAFTLVAVLTLALGIGATTAIFSVVNAVLLRPLPWPQADRLVLIWGTRGPVTQNGVDYLDYLDWQRESRSFAGLGVMRGQSVNLTGGDQPERVIGSFVSSNFLSILGETPAQGRFFTETEGQVATKQPVAVISDDFWHNHLGGRPDMLGRTLILNGVPCTVVGIMRPGAAMPLGTPDVLMPIGYYPNKGDLELRGRPGVLVVGRLKPGVTREVAQADLDAIERRLATAYPATNAGTGANVTSLTDQIVGPVRTPMLIVLGAVGIVLLIACANVANLQLARAAARRRELSVRTALGAGRSRLVRQLLTESVVLSLAGGAIGILLARWGVTALAAQLASSMPVQGAITLDASVLLFAVAVTLGAGLIFGSAPAWQYSRADVQDALTVRADAGGGRSNRFGMRSTLVAAQIALSVILLVSAGLLTRSLVALFRVEPGFDPTHTLTLQFRLPAAKYKADAQIADMFARSLEEIRHIPGVENAALVRAAPLNGNGESYPYFLADKPIADPQSAPTAQLNIVSPGYFATLHIPRLTGRDFTMADRADAAPVVIVNDQLARHAWPNEPPIGKHIRLGGNDSSWATVIGVVGTTKHFRLSEHPLDQAYIPYLQRPLIFTEAVVRATGDPAKIANAVRSAIWRVDRDQPVWGVRTMDRVLETARGGPKLTVSLMAAFAALALILAAIGVYGVMSYAVTRRTQEVGIRMALGARSGQVLTMVLREGMRTIVIALAVGLAGAAAGTRLLASQLFGVSTVDPVTFTAVPVLLALVALAACYLPARRASRVDPIVALRND
jgi:putative ABC transport system permease protein